MFKWFVQLPETARSVLYVVLCVILGLLLMHSLIEPPLFFVGVVASYAVCFYPSFLGHIAGDLIRLKKYTMAISVCNYGLKLTPENPYLLSLRSVALLQNGQSAEALVDADRAIELGIKGWQVWSNRGSVALQLRDYAVAESNADRAIEMKVTAKAPYVVRSWARYLRHNPVGCLSDCEHFYQSPEYAEEARLLKVLANVMYSDRAAAELVVNDIRGKATPGNREYIALVDFENHLSNHVEVLRLCAEVAEDTRESCVFRIFQAYAYHNLQEGALAWRSALSAETSKPKHFSIIEIRALILSEAGYLDEALAECLRPEVLTSSVSLRSGEANVRWSRGEFDEMLAAAQYGIRLNARSASMHGLYGIALAELGRLEEATAEAAEALKLNRASEAVQYALGAIHFKANQLTQSLEHLNTAIAINSHCKSAYSKRAEVFRSLGKVAEAESDETRAHLLQTQYMADLAPLLQDYLDDLQFAGSRTR